MKPRTTLKFTSASRSATRTSRSASWMFSSVSRPRLPSRSNTVCNRVLRESNMEIKTLREHAADFKCRHPGPGDASTRRRDARQVRSIRATSAGSGRTQPPQTRTEPSLGGSEDRVEARSQHEVVVADVGETRRAQSGIRFARRRAHRAAAPVDALTSPLLGPSDEPPVEQGLRRQGERASPRVTIHRAIQQIRFGPELDAEQAADHRAAIARDLEEYRRAHRAVHAAHGGVVAQATKGKLLA